MTEPIIARLREKYKNANVKIITVSIDKGKASALTLSKKTNYTVFMDGRGMYNDFHGNGIPLFYLVDKQGLIATRHDGYSYELEEQLTAEIEKIK
jgi:thiol-disulfide isomerase/thioredoxin